MLELSEKEKKLKYNVEFSLKNSGLFESSTSLLNISLHQEETLRCREALEIEPTRDEAGGMRKARPTFVPIGDATTVKKEISWLKRFEMMAGFLRQESRWKKAVHCERR